MEAEDFAVTIRQSIEHAAQQRGNIELMLVNNATDAEVALDNARRLIDAKVDLAIEDQLYERINHAIMDMFRLAGIPVIAIDIPMPGALFFGADNYRAGRIAGEAAVAWIKKHWHGQLHKIVCVNQSYVGPLPAGRLHGQMDALRSAFVVADRDIIQLEATHNLTEHKQSGITQALRNVPWGKNVLVIGIDGGTALSALQAAEALGRQQCTAVVAQNVNTAVRLELKHGNPMLIGAVDYFPEHYGTHVIRMAMDILEGRSVPPAVYSEHKLIVPDDVRHGGDDNGGWRTKNGKARHSKLSESR